MACPFMLSSDNIELQFATNHLGMISLEEHMILQFCFVVELYRHGEEHFLCVLYKFVRSFSVDQPSSGYDEENSQ